MNKTETVRNEMVKAMKQHDNERKLTLSLLLQSLQKSEKDKRAILSDAEADAVVLKEIKQTQETLDMCPADRTDIISECENRISVLKEFAPHQLSEQEIKAEIEKVLSEINIIKPTRKEKGIIMKVIMPRLKGKADGKIINNILDGILE